MLSHWLQKSAACIDKITTFIGRLVSWLTLLMVLLSLLIVVLRYGFNWGSIALQESVLYLHGFVFLLGASYALKEDAHVRIDIFYQKFSVKTKAYVNILGTLILLIPFCLFIFIVSADYITQSWSIYEKSAEAGGLPFVYISKSFIWLMAFFLGLQGLSTIFKNVLIIKKQSTTGEW